MAPAANVCYSEPDVSTTDREYLWIDRAEGLDALARALATTTELALDTESNSMFAYRERLCLVQLGLGSLPGSGAPTNVGVQLVALDPFAFATPREALQPLAAWLTRGERVLLHGGEYDVAVLKRELGAAPTNVYDTQAAAALLGLPKTGYANLCGELLGVSLSKEHQRFDWARRPIPSGPLRYALDDVRYLPALAREIEARVRAADLEEEVAIACRAVADALPHEGTSEADRFWRAVGGAKLSREVLARLSALVSWREREAQQRDQPPALLISNDTLQQLAHRAPTRPEDLEGVGLPRRLLAERAAALLEALHTPAPIPEKPRRPPSDPAVENRKTRLKAWRDTESKRRAVTAQVVLPTRALDALASTGPGVDFALVPQLGDKRIRLYGEALRKLLSG